MAVILHTNLGLITIDLYVKERPQTARNFIKLCKAKYYNNCLFFNIQSDFIVQTGDPTNTGRGGTSLNGLLYGPQVRNQLQSCILCGFTYFSLLRHTLFPFVCLALDAH